MTSPDSATVFDTRHVNTARVCNALVGGKDAYDLDRVVAERLLTSQLAVALREQRRFARRAVEYLVTAHQVSQVVELGCGYPQPPSIGEIATGADRNARTLYIDNDPLAATHARARFGEPNSVVAEVELTDVDAVAAQIDAVMDTGAPLAVCLSGTAELLADAPAVLENLTRRLPAGTWLVFSHLTDDISRYDVSKTVAALGDAGVTFHPRDRDTITAMLAPYRIADPGLVSPHRWRPDSTGHSELRPLHPDAWDLCAYAALGQRHP